MTPIQEVIKVLRQTTGRWNIDEDNVAHVLEKMLVYAEQHNPKGLACVIRHGLNEPYTGAVDMKKLEFGNPWKPYESTT